MNARRGGALPPSASRGMAGLCVAVLLTAAVVMVPGVAAACAGCRNPNIPQARVGGGVLDQGAFLVGATLATSPVRVSHPAGCANPADCDEVPVQPEHTHDLSMVPAELRVNAAWSATRTFGIDLDVPVRLVVARVSYATPAGDPYTPTDADVHHRNETLVGVGDIALRGRMLTPLGRWWLTTRLGLTLPTGRTEPDPFAAGDRGQRHQHLQFGTGTVDPTLGLDVSRSAARYDVSVYAQAQLSLYDNRHGFRGPVRALVGSSAAWKHDSGLALGGALEGAVEGSERWQGVARSDGSLGRTELMVGPNLSFTTGSMTYSAMARAIVYRHIVEGSEDAGDLQAPVVVALGATWVLPAQ